VEPCIEGIESRYFDLAKLTLVITFLHGEIVNHDEIMNYARGHY